MRLALVSTALLVAGLMAGCGELPTQARATNLRSALINDAEQLEFVSQSSLQGLLEDAYRISRSEAGRTAKPNAPFLVELQSGELVAAPGLDARTDLLQPPDGGQPAELSFGDRGDLRWPEDRRMALGGLSEREAAEQVARSLLALWGISADSVLVVRAPNAPYAAALTDDGTLRLNPAFLYMAAGGSGISPHVAEVQ
ncbi:MAG TPA: hypothetical protein VKE49_09065 [Myxococcaceae bacterium]|nr:hypothetical protein [Myxococcaceae bacterium]